MRTARRRRKIRLWQNIEDDKKGSSQTSRERKKKKEKEITVASISKGEDASLGPGKRKAPEISCTPPRKNGTRKELISRDKGTLSMP